MEETLAQLEALSGAAGRVAMATLVGFGGASPKKEGAKMWVGEDGRVLGAVTIGGCVDGRVIAEAEAVLASGAPRLLSMALGDEDAWELGLSCGGTVEVLIETLAPMGSGPVAAAYARIAAEVLQGRAACLVRKLDDPARTLILLEGGGGEGSLGDPALDALAGDLGAELMRKGQSRAVPLGSGRAFFEVHAPREALVIVGAGHVSMPLVALGRTLGFRTTVLDARPRYASRERFPDADELKVGIASELVESLSLHARSALVLTVHDYKVEVPVLRAALKTQVGYIGMLGNRRRGQGVKDLLREQGVAETDLARVQVPVGLDIGAQSAAEIALSVLAQIVAVRAGKVTGGLAEAKEKAAAAPPGSPR